jgi:hypothetical protein
MASLTAASTFLCNYRALICFAFVASHSFCVLYIVMCRRNIVLVIGWRGLACIPFTPRNRILFPKKGGGEINGIRVFPISLQNILSATVCQAGFLLFGKR